MDLFKRNLNVYRERISTLVCVFSAIINMFKEAVKNSQCEDGTPLFLIYMIELNER